MRIFLFLAVALGFLRSLSGIIVSFFQRLNVTTANVPEITPVMAQNDLIILLLSGILFVLVMRFYPSE